MTQEEFEIVDRELLKVADAVLLQRRGAYAKDGDKLANFKMVAAETGLTSAKVCEVYMRKANIAVGKLLNGQEVPGETREERFADALNYVRLAYAICRERDVVEPTSDQVARRGVPRDEALKALQDAAEASRPVFPYGPGPYEVVPPGRGRNQSRRLD